ncbi:MAG: APC family permease, partial [Pseudomonadota bacterium]
MTKPQQMTDDAGLEKSLGGFSLFVLAFGTIIGIGWVTVVGSWIADGGAAGAALGFILGGLIMLPLALCYAEVAGMFPVAGGELAYVYEMYGERWAFFAGWLLAYTYVATTAFEAVSVAWVLAVLFPGTEGPVLYTFLGADVRLWSVVAGIAIMFALAVINYLGATATAFFQTLMVGALILFALIFIAAGLSNGDTSNLQPLFAGDTLGLSVSGVLVVMASTPFWFAGFDTIPQAMGEVSDKFDLRKLPMVMAVSICIAIAFYLLIILTASTVVNRETLLAADLPLAGAAEAAFNSVIFRNVVLVAGLCGLLTTWNAMFFAATRLIYALGRARMVPHSFAKLHSTHGTPSLAIVFVAVVGSLGAFMGREAIGLIVDSAALVFSAIFVIVIAGTQVLRRRLPDHPRPFTFPGGTIGLSICLLLAITVFLLAAVGPLISS